MTLLDRLLDDEWVVIHAAHPLFIVHPEFGIFAAAVLPAGVSVDASGVYTGGKAEMEAAIAAVSASAMELSLQIGAQHRVAEIFLSERANLPDMGIVRIDPSLAQNLILQGIAGPGDEAVTHIIATAMPGTSRYQRGQVTPAQAAWRKRVAEPAIPAAGPPAIRLPVKPRKPVPPAEERMLLGIRTAIRKTIGSNEATFDGVTLDMDDVCGEAAFLPVILVAVSEMWAPFVHGHQNKGGFEILLEPDPRSLVGFRVQKVIPSSPITTLLPLISFVRGHTHQGVFKLDRALAVFETFLKRHKISAEVVDLGETHKEAA